MQIWIYCVVLEALVSQSLESTVFHNRDLGTVWQPLLPAYSLLCYCTILQASGGDSAHSPQGGWETSALDMTGTFPGRPSIPPAASGFKSSTLGYPEGLQGPGEVGIAQYIPIPRNASRLWTSPREQSGTLYQPQEPLRGNPAPRKLTSVLLGAN